jgi:glycerophosphoryl diester phosphodiesterase
MRKTFFIILTILIFNACDLEFDILNLNDNEITTLGHGGMGSGNVYPMNSFESIVKCINQGVDGSEIDIQMTKDSVLVAIHDQDLSSTTNIEGRVNSLNWNEIENANYTQSPYLNYSVISLEQLFSNIKNVQKYTFTFDCKLYNSSSNDIQYYTTYINAIIDIIEKYQLENNIQIESANQVFLSLFKSVRPTYRLFIYPSSFQSGLDIALNLDLYGIIISSDEITSDQVLEAHNNNISIALWSVKTRSEHIDAINKSPDFIQSDNIKYLFEFLH